jgi:hypothetical protein
MTSKSEWNSLNHDLTPEQPAAKVSDPPTAEEVLAYSRGELPPHEEERVRELLVQYPEIARVMFASVPEGETQPGEPGYVSDIELARRRGALEDRLQIPKTAPARAQRGPARMWRYLPMAAAFVIVSGLYIQAALEVRRLAAELNEPRVAVTEQLLQPDAKRGGPGERVTVDLKAGTYTLVMPLGQDAQYLDYRLVLLDYATQKPLWKSETLHRPAENQTFSIFFRRESLQPGEYQMLVYGLRDGKEEHFDTISFTVLGAAR